MYVYSPVESYRGLPFCGIWAAIYVASNYNIIALSFSRKDATEQNKLPLLYENAMQP